MKIGIFTDSHYSSAEITCGKRHNSASLDKIAEAYRYFAAEGCGPVICLGDLIDREDDHQKEIQNLTAVSEIIRASGLHTVCVMGNHDAFTFTQDEFYSITGALCRPPLRITSSDGKTLLFVDACYYASGEPYAPGKGNWKDTFYPHTEQLRRELDAAEDDVYIFMHQNIDPEIPENHRLSNDAELREILERSGKVRTVFQGHYHKGNVCELNGIRYVTYPAMCEGEGRRYVVEL